MVPHPCRVSSLSWSYISTFQRLPFTLFFQNFWEIQESERKKKDTYWICGPSENIVSHTLVKI